MLHVLVFKCGVCGKDNCRIPDFFYGLEVGQPWSLCLKCEESVKARHSLTQDLATRSVL